MNRIARVGPFEGHLREAIALNLERAPRYAALSRGASRSISRDLVAAERLLLPVARWFDRRAGPWHEAGVPLLEALFVSMELAPPFGAVPPSSDAGTMRPAPSPRAIRQRVGRGWRTGAFPGAASALAGELAELSEAPGRDCMVRHLLESAHRLASLAPAHVALSLERDLPSPAPLLARLFRMHLWGLEAGASLDRRARPLQARGITILAADLPSIPVECVVRCASDVR